MKVPDLTSDPPGVSAKVLEKRFVIVAVSGVLAYAGFFASAILISDLKRNDLIGCAGIAFVGFIPGLYAWITGWIARWKTLVFGFLVAAPIGAITGAILGVLLSSLIRR